MILNVYKPKGWTSNDVVQKIKHTGKFKKVGHAGTLDPLAEGVLLILTEQDTKRQHEFMGLRKEYLVEVAFGYESDSHDLGTPLRKSVSTQAEKLTQEAVQKALVKYLGVIEQQVPAYSAVHVKGQRLYKTARTQDSEKLVLPYKKVEVFDISLESFKENDSVENLICPTAQLRIVCGKGTYIRSLARDIGRDLNYGAVVVSLIRTKIGDYIASDSVDLDTYLKSGCLRS